jgi:hypothetical protein
LILPRVDAVSSGRDRRARGAPGSGRDRRARGAPVTCRQQLVGAGWLANLAFRYETTSAMAA